MKILLYDCETNGKPKDYKAPVTDVDNWPRVIQLAWQLTDQWGNEVISKGNYFIKPEGWTIPDGPEDTFWREHGLTMEKCETEGVAMRFVLDHFVSDLQDAAVLVSHNMQFDYGCVGAEMIRAGAKSKNRPVKICTMESSVNYCQIKYNAKQKRYPGQSYKWPKLLELAEHLWPGMIKGQTHHAHEDVEMLKLCFFELVRRHIIKLPT